MIDLEGGGEFVPLAETKAFCWQQGCMAQWLPGSKRKIIFNDREGGRFVSRTLDVETGERDTLPFPVYCLSPDGRHALSVNFSRLARERPGYGYEGVPEPFDKVCHPEADGVFLHDLAAKSSRLVFSLDAAVKIEPQLYMDNYKSWFNHLLFSPDGKRFVFVHRWRLPYGSFLTRLITANADGGGVLRPEFPRH